MEILSGDGVMTVASDITLKSFKVGGEDVWMPVAADTKQYVERDARRDCRSSSRNRPR